MKSTSTAMPKSSKVSAGMTDRPVAGQHESAQSEVEMSDAETREVMTRIAAYSFYDRRGFVSGHELEDWLQAEVEVERQLAAVPRPKEAK